VRPSPDSHRKLDVAGRGHGHLAGCLRRDIDVPARKVDLPSGSAGDSVCRTDTNVQWLSVFATPDE
jgi:hypothetical protein